MGTNARPPLLALVAVLAAVLIAFLAIFLTSRPSTPAATLDRSEAKPLRWYFTDPGDPEIESNRVIGLDDELASFIETARVGVDMAIYQLDLPNVVESLIAAQGRGARVRVVTDIDTLKDADESDSFDELIAAGIKVVGGNPNAIMHDKFVVVDGRSVWTGTWNFTANDTFRYDNAAILVESAELARRYTETFEEMFESGRFGAKREANTTTSSTRVGDATIEVHFSPEDAPEARLVELVEGARESVDFLAFSFTDDDIGNAMMARAKAGVRVRGVFETTGSGTEYSEYGRMKKAGIDVRKDATRGFMHVKAIIVDSRSVAVGSYNFTEAARDKNDENLLVIESRELAAAFEREFRELYAAAFP